MELKFYVNGCRGTSHSTQNETLVHRYTRNSICTSTEVEARHIRLSRRGL
ncbi:hypothetical protein Hdeb2414_s0950g00965701 [Helianthus debilis subsp. tardiflorus]